jgi:uncharacterized protein (DUF58 family)
MAPLESVRSLRPTRRGLAVAAVAVLAFALGATAGARSLNAVVVPALVGLAAGAVQLARADTPAVERSTPDPGFAGARRRVAVDVETAVPCTLTERVDGGVAVEDDDATGDGTHVAAVGHGGHVEYGLEYRRRGAHDLGPAICRLTDSLGLFARRVETEATATAIVYPDVYAVEGEAMADLVSRRLGEERSSFDRLREFSPGDAMRDIHWRASAKRGRDEFVVAEYDSRSEATHVDLVGESALDGADAMASAVASLALHLHDAGVTVTVTVPAGRVVVHPGDSGSLLRLLALTGDGHVEDSVRADADVVVIGEGSHASVRVADRELDVEGLFGGHRGREVVA